MTENNSLHFLGSAAFSFLSPKMFASRLNAIHWRIILTEWMQIVSPDKKSGTHAILDFDFSNVFSMHREMCDHWRREKWRHFDLALSLRLQYLSQRMDKMIPLWLQWICIQFLFIACFWFDSIKKKTIEEYFTLFLRALMRQNSFVDLTTS